MTSAQIREYMNKEVKRQKAQELKEMNERADAFLKMEREAERELNRDLTERQMEREAERFAMKHSTRKERAERLALIARMAI